MKGGLFYRADRLAFFRGNSIQLILEPVCKIRKEEDRSNRNHGREVGGSFFIASGDATKLLETIDKPFDDVSFSIVLFVEGSSATFIATMSNRTTNMFSMKVVPKGMTSIAFIRN